MYFLFIPNMVESSNLLRAQLAENSARRAGCMDNMETLPMFPRADTEETLMLGDDGEFMTTPLPNTRMQAPNHLPASTVKISLEKALEKAAQATEENKPGADEKTPAAEKQASAEKDGEATKDTADAAEKMTKGAAEKKGEATEDTADAAEKVTKGAAEKVTKDAADAADAAEKMTKGAAEKKDEATKDTADAAEKMTKGAAEKKDEATKDTADAAEKVTKGAAENATKDAAENATKDAAENAAKDAAEKVSKGAAEKVSKGAAENATKDAEEKVSKGAAEKADGVSAGDVVLVEGEDGLLPAVCVEDDYGGVHDLEDLEAHLQAEERAEEDVPVVLRVDQFTMKNSGPKSKNKKKKKSKKNPREVVVDKPDLVDVDDCEEPTKKRARKAKAKAAPTSATNKAVSKARPKAKAAAAKAKALPKAKATAKAKAKATAKAKGAKATRPCKSRTDALQEPHNAAVEASAAASPAAANPAMQTNAPIEQPKERTNRKRGKGSLGKSPSKRKLQTLRKQQAAEQDPQEEAQQDLQQAPKRKRSNQATAAKVDEPTLDADAAPQKPKRARKPKTSDVAKDKSFARRACPKTSPAKTKWLAIRDTFQKEIRQQLLDMGSTTIYNWEELGVWDRPENQIRFFNPENPVL